VKYGTSGIGSDDHIAGELLSGKADIEMKHIPFAGASANRTALLGKHVTLGIFNIT
jgi:tripartite-type tricarboxylate transporter receptor subunit TctC